MSFGGAQVYEWKSSPPGFLQIRWSSNIRMCRERKGGQDAVRGLVVTYHHPSSAAEESRFSCLLEETLNPGAQARTTCKCLAFVPAHRLRIRQSMSVSAPFKAPSFRCAESVFNGPHIQTGNPQLKSLTQIQSRLCRTGEHQLSLATEFRIASLGLLFASPRFLPRLARFAPPREFGGDGLTSPVALQVT